GGNGTISPSTPQTVNHGATTSFTLTPAANFHVANVAGTCGGSLAGNVYTTNAVNADCTVIASFAIDTHVVTPSVSGGNGTISPSTPQTVNHGATAIFTLTPAANFHVANVAGTCGGSLAGNVYTTNAVNADCTVIASFAIDTHVVTPSVSGGDGTISPSTPQTVNHGATVAFTVTPAAGYHVVTPVGGSCPAGSLVGTSYTTGAVVADCTVVVSFAANPAHHIKFVQQPADVPRGERLGAVQVAIVDASDNVITTDSTSQITLATAACGASATLAQATVSNGIASFPANATQRFYTLATGKTLSASSGALAGTSATFNVTSAGSVLVFADGFDLCRL
ncbi:MAG: InlB B-repeat-containing protein, partial [Dokdonella sp.]|uniref:InlB B-repeat-containing protein n=1 Tax=Dokdonella sp. TaxID=2291710 RepID=UPI003F80729A